MKDDKKVIELIRKFQQDRDESAKNELLSMYYEVGCKWAKNRIKKLVYTDLISPSHGEIASMVYQSFEKGINTIKLDDENAMSFQNYFFMMIRFQIYSELRTTLNYKMIPNFQQEMANLVREMKELPNQNADYMKDVIVNHSLTEIIEFLEDKNPEYARIIMMKSQGHKAKEICQALNISPMSLKSRVQYIKKLVHKEFAYPFL